MPEIKLDLRGVRCPLNYVKTKLKLEELAEGELLEVMLDDGEPILNVPKSAREDGNQIVTVARDGEYFRVVIKKG